MMPASRSARPGAGPNPGLVRLTARRALGGGLVPVLALLGWLAARADWAPDAAALGRLAVEAHPGELAHGLGLRAVWSLLLLAGVPALVLRAAGTIPRWRRGEIHWLASSPASRGSIALSAGLGLALAAAAFVLAVSVAGAAGARGQSDDGPRLEVRRLPEVPSAVLDGSAPLRVELEIPEDATWLRLFALPVGAGHSSRLRAELTRGSERRAAEALVATPAELRVQLPPAEEGAAGAPVTLVVERVGDGPLVALRGDRLEALIERRTAHGADLALAARALLALLAWLALAFGLGAWMSGTLAGSLTLALALLDLVRGASLGAFGFASGLVRALDLIGEGVVPPPLPGATLFSACAAVALGWALATAGLRDWRRGDAG